MSIYPERTLLPERSKYLGMGRRMILYTRCAPLLHHTQAQHKIQGTGSTLRACLSHCLYPLWDFSLLIVKNILLIFDSSEYTASLQSHALGVACPQLLSEGHLFWPQALCKNMKHLYCHQAQASLV